MRLGGGAAVATATQLTSSWPLVQKQRDHSLPEAWQSPAQASSLEGLRIDENSVAFQLETFCLLNVERLLKLDNYLQQQVSAHAINQTASDIYKNAVYEFIAAFGPKAGVPDACPGPDGQMIYYWRRKSDSVQLDVKPNGDAELYYLNRSTNGDFLLEYQVGALSNEIAVSPDVRGLFSR